MSFGDVGSRGAVDVFRCVVGSGIGLKKDKPSASGLSGRPSDKAVGAA